jgi:cell division inhibitor SepF
MGAALRDDYGSGEYRGWLTPSGNYPAPAYDDAWETQPSLRPLPDPVEPQPVRIASVKPTGFESAREIGEHVRAGTPVIMDVSGMPDGDAKRLVDFASGLVFGTRGSIERIARRVFLLAPPEAEVVVIDGARDDSGFYNQS